MSQRTLRERVRTMDYPEPMTQLDVESVLRLAVSDSTTEFILDLSDEGLFDIDLVSLPSPEEFGVKIPHPRHPRRTHPSESLEHAVLKRASLAYLFRSVEPTRWCFTIEECTEVGPDDVAIGETRDLRAECGNVDGYQIYRDIKFDNIHANPDTGGIVFDDPSHPRFSEFLVVPFPSGETPSIPPRTILGVRLQSTGNR